MDTVLRSVRPLDDFRLELKFQNGSIAIVNMERSVQTMRFSRIASKEIFATARAEGDKVVWADKGMPFGVYCRELLDAMMMD